MFSMGDTMRELLSESSALGNTAAAACPRPGGVF
jgi:hypothetical protein